MKISSFCQISPVLVTEEYACFDTVTIKHVRKLLEELQYLRKKESLNIEKVIVLENTITSYKEIDTNRKVQDNIRINMLSIQEKEIKNLNTKVKKYRIQNKFLKISSGSTIFICILLIFL